MVVGSVVAAVIAPNYLVPAHFQGRLDHRAARGDAAAARPFDAHKDALVSGQVDALIGPDAHGRRRAAVVVMCA